MLNAHVGKLCDCSTLQDIYNSHHKMDVTKIESDTRTRTRTLTLIASVFPGCFVSTGLCVTALVQGRHS